MTKIKIIFSLLILVTALIVFGIPPLIKSQLELRLADFLKLDVSIKSIELHPIRGEFLISTLKIGDSLALADAKIQMDMLPLLNEHIQISSISIDGFVTGINKQGDLITVGEYQIPSPAPSSGKAPQPSWTYQIDTINIENTQLDLDIDGHTHHLKMDTLEIGPIITELNKAITLSVDLRFDETPVNVRGEYEFSSNKHKFDGDLLITKMNFLQLESLLEQPVQGFVTTDQKLVFSGNPDVFILATEGTTKVTRLKFEDIEAAELSFKQKLKTTRTIQNLKIETQGDFEIQNLLVAKRKIASLNWMGRVGFEQSIEKEPNELPFNILVDGDLSVTGLLDASFGKIDTADITSISFVSGKTLTADSVVLNGMDGSLTRVKDGTIEGISADQTSNSAPVEIPSETAPEAASSSSPADILPLAGVNIGRLEILNSRLKFIDQHVTPATTLTLNDVNLNVSPVSMVQDQHYTFIASHQADDSREATLESKGMVNLSGPISGKADLKLQNFELHEIGAYMGGSVQSGRLTLSTGLNIDAGTVHLENNILIESMKLSKTQAKDLNSDGTSAALALYLLKDKKGNVELDVPIETNLENFSIGTQDIVSKALSSAAQKAALNYAKFALQPYGSLLLLKDIAGVISQPRFEPIIFEPGATEMTENAAAYTKKIADLLSNKPEVRVTICGVSTLSDIPETKNNFNADNQPEAQLEVSQKTPEDAYFLALATQRGDIIREAIEGYGIEATRIFSCKPIIERTKTKARVELSL